LLSGASLVAAGGAAVALVASLGGRLGRHVQVGRQGLKDRVKKDFSTKSAMIKKLGKLVLQREFDMRTQIMEDPKLALRCQMTQEELLLDFERCVDYIKTNIGLNQMESEITVSKIATGLYMQYLGRPNFPSNEEMNIVLDWLLANLAVSREDGSLAKCVANYPFVLSRTIEELNESKRFCPEDIDYNIAVAEDPALIDKTYNCDGICANQCVACWYNG